MALMKKLTSAIVASSLVLGLVGTAGATTPDKVQNAAGRMHTLGLVQGVDQNGDLALNSNITRAQLVTILVRAFGQDANAKYLNGAPSFSDSANHPWASGYIALAKKLIEERSGGKEAVGYPDGSFNPDGNVTSAEAVAFLMKFLGVARDTTQSWPMDYINGAFNSGFITAEDKAVLEGIKDTPATRGLAFYLADSAFYSTKIAEGGTVYTTFVKNTKPVVTVDEYAHTTLESQVTLTGTVSQGVTAVYVGSMENAATLANGKFTATVNLNVGENNLTVTAVDLAGNTTSVAVKISHSVGDAASIEAADITVAAGASVDVAAAVKDAKGNTVADAALTGESTVGSFADGKFTAGEKAGSGTLTLKAGEITKDVKVTVVAGALAKVEGETSSVAPGKSVKLIAKDAYGNPVEGATFSQSSNAALLDANNGNFVATTAGSYTVKATKGDITVEGTIGVFGKAASLVATAPEKVVGNGKTTFTISVSAVDREGNVVSDFDDEIEYEDTALTPDKDTKTVTKNGVTTFTFKAGADLADSIQDITFKAYDADKHSKLSLTQADVSIEVVAQQATTIVVEAPEYLPSNNKNAAQEVTVKVKDQAGVNMTSGSWDMDVTISGPARLDDNSKSGSVVITTAAKTFDVLPDERGGTGSVDITVAYEGLKSGKATMKAAYATSATALRIESKDDSIDVNSAADAKDDSDSYAEYTVRVVDRAGVPVTDDAETRTVRVNVTEFVNTDRIFVSQGELQSDGTWEFGPFRTFKTSANRDVETFSGEGRFRIATNAADDSFKVAVSDLRGTLTSSSALTLASKAADAAVVAFANSGLTLQKANRGSGKVTAQLYDRFGNKAEEANVKLTFSTESGNYDELDLNGDAKEVTVRTDAHGAASVTVNITAKAGEQVIVVENEGLSSFLDRDDEWAAPGRLYDTVIVKMSADIATKMTADWLKQDDTTKAPNYQVSDDTLTLRLTVKDSYGGGMTGLKEKDFQLSFNDADVQKQYDGYDAVHPLTFVVDGDGDYLFTGIIPKTTGTLTATAVVATVGNDVKVTRSISVKAGVPASYRIAESTASVDARKILVDANKATAFTINLRDKEGNTVDPASVKSAVTISIEKLFDPTQPASGKSGYLDIRDANGATITSIVIPAGRATGKFYVVANIENGEIKLSSDADAEGVFGASPTTYYVNPTAGK